MSDPRTSPPVVLSIGIVVVGLALIVRTVADGGGALAVGVILGVLFVLAGAGRTYVAIARSR